MALVDLILRLQKGEPLTNQEMDDNLSNLLVGIVQSSCDWAGPLEPEETFPYLRWIDTSTNPPTNKIRNAEDDSWITLGSATTPLGTAATRDVGTEPGEIPTNSDLRLRENIKVTVGAGGDFPTINAAVLHLSRLTPDLGVTAEVELQSGFVMEEQLFVHGLDLGWITITGVDSETVINEPSLTRYWALNMKPAFGVTAGTLPTIGQLFIFSSKGNPDDRRVGVMAHSAGRANILEGCGVKNAGRVGILATDSSVIDAVEANVRGAGLNCIEAYRCCTINAQGVDASEAGSIGIRAILASVINVEGANVRGAGEYCIYASNGSTVNAQGADVSEAGSVGVYANQRSSINAHAVNTSGAGTFGFQVVNGSAISAGATTGTLSQTSNTVTASGVIFRA